MTFNMKKQALLALMLALTLILSGCTLIQKDAAVDAATVILQLGDQVVTKGEIQEEVQNQLNYMSYLYSMYGYNFDPTSAEAIAEAQQTVINSFKQKLVSNAKIAEMGLDQLTEEDQETIRKNAESTYQSNLDYLLSSNYADSELSDEEKNEKAKADLEATGYTMETALKDARETFLSNKLRQEIIKDVQVTDEEIQADYDSKVASAKETYENNASSWATAANNGSTLYYTPAGVRFVKQILVKFTEDDQKKIDEANTKVTEANTKVTEADGRVSDAQAIVDSEDASEEDKTAAKADLEAAQADLTAAQEELTAAQAAVQEATDTAFANIDAAADEVLAELEAGADWNTLMADKTQDPGMQSGITAERGYAVCADMTSFDSAFVQAAMALEKIGDVSPKTRGNSYGYYIIRYEADAKEGAVALDEVKETISSSLLTTKQNETYNSQIQAWVDAADFKENLDALKD